MRQIHAKSGNIGNILLPSILRNWNITDSDKVDILCNFVDESVFEHISESGSYENAIEILQQVYAKKPNEIFARHLLHSCKQQVGESVDEYLQRLKVLSGDCNYVTATAERCSDVAIRDAFITGISWSAMRKRLLERRGDDLTLTAVIDKARSLENAYNDSAKYGATLLEPYSAVATDACQSTLKESKVVHAEASSCSAASRETKGKCWYCGRCRHPRQLCPARNATCFKCGKKGHFAQICGEATPSSLEGFPLQWKNRCYNVWDLRQI